MGLALEGLIVLPGFTYFLFSLFDVTGWSSLSHFIGRMEPPTLPVTIKPIFLKMKVFIFSSTNILLCYFYAYYHKTFVKWSGINLVFFTPSPYSRRKLIQGRLFLAKMEFLKEVQLVHWYIHWLYFVLLALCVHWTEVMCRGNC